ncbi:hypothetical protein JTE90_016565 [Oedothorax gibbosus]|uniref:Uncharacterized protein n=1 Tax=Oedothorax gibbosus TaxID=931172 RepID=A0AAV6UAW4_9ARAC|nr:hypothetical protein JTE90_016565 [Oedothorax gibbosus]
MKERTTSNVPLEGSPEIRALETRVLSSMLMTITTDVETYRFTLFAISLPIAISNHRISITLSKKEPMSNLTTPDNSLFPLGHRFISLPACSRISLDNKNVFEFVTERVFFYLLLFEDNGEKRR